MINGLERVGSAAEKAAQTLAASGCGQFTLLSSRRGKVNTASRF